MKYGLGFLPDDAILAQVTKVERSKAKTTEVEAGIGDGKIIRFAAPRDVKVKPGETVAVIGPPRFTESDARSRHPSRSHTFGGSMTSDNVVVSRANATFKIPGQPDQMLVVTTA